MDRASHQSAQHFGWVPPRTLNRQDLTRSRTIHPAPTWDDAEPVHPWAETIDLRIGHREHGYWVPGNEEMPLTIVRRPKKVVPIKLSNTVRYPLMVAVTVATLGSGGALVQGASSAQAAPASSNTDSFRAVSAPDAGAGNEDESVAPEAAQTASGGSTSYTVQAGDTLRGIAANFGIDTGSLIEANGIANPDLIYPGDEIFVPAAADYASSSVTVVVKSGDTINKLASQYGVNATAIINYEPNGITNPNLIYPGQELTIPGGVEPVAEAQQTTTAEPASDPQPQPEPQPEPQQQTQAQAQPEPEPEPQPEPEPEPEPANNAVGQQIVDLAMQYVGAPYVWGATGPNSFDCSGFTYYILNQVVGGISRDMTVQAQTGVPVSPDNLQPGDIVFQQNTYKAGLSHVGIYIGDGKFVNAASPGSGVTVSNLWDSYWGPRFHSARRIQ